jgi:glutathione peroxidase
MIGFMLLFHCMLLMAPVEGGGGASSQGIYDFRVPGLLGDTIDFSGFKGKKILIVNTASKCGYTPQYEELEKLYEDNKDKLVIVGFPANNFGAQEPGTNEEIAEFCQRNYGVTFPMAAKISVKGDDMAPIYHWLTSKSRNHYQDSEVKWNFQKYLIDEKGRLVAVFPSAVTPDSREIEEAIRR